jgi:dTDP-4-amino-4,6-dideoxygalactose transaminase
MTAVESPRLRVPLIKPDLPTFDEVAGAFREVLESGRVTNFGKYVTEFEQEAGSYLGSQVASLSSGTLGLLFGLQALGLQRGQRVVLPSFTFMATAQAVLYAGGVPVFVDINDDLTMSSSDLESVLHEHPDVGVVLAVHTYGLPCRVDEIEQVTRAAARRQGKSIGVMYDGAHAFGAALADGRRVGTFGDMEVFSLSVTKLLVSVEGGLISSRDGDLIHKIRKMRNYGIGAPYDAEIAGLNGKMSELHAAVGLHNLRRLPHLLQQRKQKASYYAQHISEQTSFELAPLPTEVVHTYKDFTVLTPRALDGRRDAIMRFLAERGVETRPYFSPPLHQQQLFARFADRPLPETTRAARRVITIPFYTSMSEQEMDYVVEALSQAEVTCRA